MMAYTQENIVSSTQENADNNLRRTLDNRDSLGAVQLGNAADAKRTLPLTQKPELSLKEKLEQKKGEEQKKKSKNVKKKEKKKKKKVKKRHLVEKCLPSNDKFKETTARWEMFNRLCREQVLNCYDTMTIDRLSGFMGKLIEFLKISVKECLTNPNKASTVKPFLNNIVYLFHMIYTDLKKFNFELMDRHNYLNKMSDLMAMVMDMEIKASQLYSCTRCKDTIAKKFRTEVKLKEHLEKYHKLQTCVEGWWKDETESSVHIGILEDEREKLISVLTSSLFIYLDDSTDHILDTMLKMTIKNKKKASRICNRIFSRILRSPQQPMSILAYARHILAFKMWKKMLDSVERQREITRLAATLLPAPPHNFREKVAMLAGIIPSVPKTKPDSAVTEYCLSNKSSKSVKYELKEQIQKYLLLINDPAKVSEFITVPDRLSFFSDNRLEFDLTDSVFADDDLNLSASQLSSTPAVISPTVKSDDIDCRRKLMTSFEDCASRQRNRGADLGASIDSDIETKYSNDAKSESQLVFQQNQLVLSSSPKNQSLHCTNSLGSTIESNVLDIDEDASNHPTTFSDLGNQRQTLSTDSAIDCERSKVSERKNDEVQVVRSSDEYANASETKLSEMSARAEKLFKCIEQFKHISSNSEASPVHEKLTQDSITCAGSETTPASKLSFSGETVKCTTQTSSTDSIIDLTKTVAADLDDSSCNRDRALGSTVSYQMCERWQVELGEIERYCLERNKEGVRSSNSLPEEDKLTAVRTNTFKDVCPVEDDCTIVSADNVSEREDARKEGVITPGNMLEKEAEEAISAKRRLCNQEDDMLAELFNEQTGPEQNEFGYLLELFNSPNDEPSLSDGYAPPWLNDSTSPPFFSLFDIDEIPLTDASAIAGVTDRSSEERSIVKGNSPSPKKTKPFEAQLSLSPEEHNMGGHKISADKRVLADSMESQLEEPLLKRIKTSTDAHNYLLTPPSTPVASEITKSSVDIQKDTSVSKTMMEKISENLGKPCSVEQSTPSKLSTKLTEDGIASSSKSVEKPSTNTSNKETTPKKMNSKPSVVDRPLVTNNNSSVEKQTACPLQCVCDQRLDGSSIDAYFTYFHRTVLSVPNQERTYIFNVSFYPLLTSDSSKSMEVNRSASSAEKRHSRVESVTRNVNIFEKDFIIFPIEKHGHWLVVIVCFPGLTGPVEYQQKEQITKHSSPKQYSAKSESSPSKARRTRLAYSSSIENKNSKETFDCDMGLNNRTNVVSSRSKSTEMSSGQSAEDLQTSIESQPIKQPCILVFDSSSETRRTEVVDVIRDYLRIEYKVKHGKDRNFATFMKDDTPKVPMRTDSASCGVYMLQYAESFFKDPIVDYRLPIKHLQNWFSTDAVSRKRNEIARFLPRPPCEPTHSASQMLHVKSVPKNRKADLRRQSAEKPDTITKESSSSRSSTKVLELPVFDKPIEVLEDCDTSDEIPFRGFTQPTLEHQHLDTVVVTDLKTASVVSDLNPSRSGTAVNNSKRKSVEDSSTLNIFQNWYSPVLELIGDDLIGQNEAMMNVIKEEEVVASNTPPNSSRSFVDVNATCSVSQPYVALSKTDRVSSYQEVKTRNSTRTAFTTNKVSTKRKQAAASMNSTAQETVIEISEPAYKGENSGQQPLKTPRKPVPRRHLVSSTTKPGRVSCNDVTKEKEKAKTVRQLQSKSCNATTAPKKVKLHDEKKMSKEKIRIQTRKQAKGVSLATPTSPPLMITPRSSLRKRKDDTPIPLRTHHLNELWKTIVKMDKKDRRCKK